MAGFVLLIGGVSCLMLALAIATIRSIIDDKVRREKSAARQTPPKSNYRVKLFFADGSEEIRDRSGGGDYVKIHAPNYLIRAVLMKGDNEVREISIHHSASLAITASEIRYENSLQVTSGAMTPVITAD